MFGSREVFIRFLSVLFKKTSPPPQNTIIITTPARPDNMRGLLLVFLLPALSSYAAEVDHARECVDKLEVDIY